MADVNAPSYQTPTMAPPVRADDQILPHIRWIPIGKSNCYLDLEKSQSKPIYKIAMDLLKNTNFFRAFTASSNLPSIYIQQFWDTIRYDKKAGCYKCQLDEQWPHEQLASLLKPKGLNIAFLAKHASPEVLQSLWEPASSSGTLSSLQHLSRDFTFGDQFFSDKPSDAKKSAETEVESMEHPQLKATTTDITTTTTMLPPPQAPQKSMTEAMMVKRIGELEHTLADLIQVNKTMEERLDKHGARLYTLEQLDIPQQVSIAEKGRESPKTPLGSPSHQSPPPPPPAGPSGTSEAPRAFGSHVTPPPTSTNQDSPSTGSATPSPAKTIATTKHKAWSTPDVTLKPLVSLTPEDLDMDEAMGPNEQAQLSNKKDIESAHIPTVNLRQGWWKPFEEERPTTPKPAWSIRSSDMPTRANGAISFGLKRSANTILLQCMVFLTGGFKDNDSTLTDTRLKMMMRFNEIHKFSDGTLQQIVEALDYRVKEFRINRMNPGLNTRFWTRKDVERCNAFMFAIQRRLRTRRIFCNLESFIGGRVREGDYRLLKRTD
nr:hypothetical protein [Tanacetum cinerariifolium]